MRDTATACVDLDQDGWFTCGTYPDCFDDDGTRHPGAFEPGSADDHDCNPIANLPPRNRVTVDLVGAGGATMIAVNTQTARYELHDLAGHQLTQIAVGGTPIAYTDIDIGERYSGVHLWEESFSIQATGETHAIPISGRGLARVQIDWTHNDLTAARSTYTIVADGRVIRTDEFTTTANGASSLTDFVALRAASFPELRWEELDQTEHDFTVTPPTTMGTSTRLVGNAADARGFLCARGPGLEVGFSAVGFVPDDPLGRGRGLRSTVGLTNQGGQQLALQYDWRFTPAIADGRYVGHSVIWAGARVGDDCVESEIRTRSFLDPVTLTVLRGGDNGVEPFDAEGDGFVEDGGYWSIAADAGAVQFQMIGGGATFGVNNLVRITGLSPTAADPVILRNGETVLVHGRDYFVDREGTTLWLYLMVSFGAETIEVISPRASCPTCGS